MDIFIVPIIASILLAFSVSPLSVLTNWFRLSWFGETLAHASLLGVGIGFALAVNPFISLVMMSLLLALMTYWMLTQHNFNDISNILAIFSHGFLAVGALFALSNTQTLNIESWLFGQIINAGMRDIYLLVIVSFLSWGFLIKMHKAIILTALHADIALIEGVNVKRIYLAVLVLLAITIAFTVQFVGILLIAALLVIPASIAQHLAKNPISFVIITAIITIIATIGGDVMAVSFNLPFGPAIVALVFTFWCCARIIKR